MSGASKTKNMLIYEKLRQEIVKGRLKPGQRLVMAELAQVFGTSETPVREAIRRLESDGHVTFKPHAGAVVTKIENRELAEIYLIRIALETLATRLAVSRINERDLDWLRKKNREMQAAIHRNRYDILARMNRDFHLRIYKAAQFPRLHKMIVDLWDAFERWPGVFSYVPERAMRSVLEHEEIIAALARSDVDRAEELMRQQKERTYNSLKNYMLQADPPVVAAQAGAGERKKKRPLGVVDTRRG